MRLTLPDVTVIMIIAPRNPAGKNGKLFSNPVFIKANATI